jgi:sugar phosphate isomerase/epimerase
MNMPDTRIVMQLYTLRDFTQTAPDFEETCRRVREIGYRAVQVSGIGKDITPEQAKAALDKHGLFCAATHESLDAYQNHFDAVVRKLRALDCNFTALGHPGKGFLDKENIGRLPGVLDEIGRKFRDEGILFGYHNHAAEFEKRDGKTFLEIIYENTDPKNLWAEVDTFWVQYGGGDPAYWLEKLGDRLYLIHLKDMGIEHQKDKAIEGGDIKMKEVGEGNLNWERILGVCRKRNVRWYAVEQDICERDPFESIRISYENLVKMGLR